MSCSCLSGVSGFFSSAVIHTRRTSCNQDYNTNSSADGSRASPKKNNFAIYCVADGGAFKASQYSWISQGTRFICLITSGDELPFNDATDASWTLCIVGSRNLKSQSAFLQCASWDTKVFRFYEVSKCHIS